MKSSWLETLLHSKKIKQLEQEVKILQQKLVERQEAINKTNAYWKKKMSGSYQKRVRV